MLSLELAIDTILKLDNNFGQTVISQIIDRFHQTNRDIYIGQFYDLNELTINNLDLSMPEDIFLSLYLQRCEKLGGSLTSLCLEVGCLLGGGNDHLIVTLKKIGTMLGTAGQIVNDVSDYIPPEPIKGDINGYKPYFSDLKAGKVTFPLFHLLKLMPLQKNKIIMDILVNKTINNSAMKEIPLWICQYSSIKSIRKIIWSYYKNLKKEVRKITKSQYRDLLSIAFSSLLTNKYFAMLREYMSVHNAKRT